MQWPYCIGHDEPSGGNRCSASTARPFRCRNRGGFCPLSPCVQTGCVTCCSHQVIAPDEDTRCKVINALIRPVTHSLSKELSKHLAACTPGFLGADLMALKRRGVALSIARGRTECRDANAKQCQLERSDLESALPHSRPTSLPGRDVQVAAAQVANLVVHSLGRPMLVWPLPSGIERER